MTTTTDLRGLRANIYVPADGRNCSNGGVSSRCRNVTIVGIRTDNGYAAGHGLVDPLPRLSQVSEPTDDAPAAVIVYRQMGRRTVVHVEPLDGPEQPGTPWMAGGCYVATSDSRFGDLVGFYGAVSFHDRTETWEEYRALSSD